MKIGDRIKKRRIELDMDADELASKIGKSRATVYRYENGDIENLPTTVLEPIAKALQTTPAYLMGWNAIEEMNMNQLRAIEESAIENLRGAFEGKQVDHFELFTKLTYKNQDKVINYTKKLYDIQELDDEQETLLAAAHERTDIEVTDEMRKHDDDVMDDENF